MVLLCSQLGSRTLTKALPGSERDLINIYWVITFPISLERAHVLSAPWAWLVCTFPAEESWLVVCASASNPRGVFTELRLRIAPNSLSGQQWDQECVPLAGWFGEKTVGFGDWLIPTLNCQVYDHGQVHSSFSNTASSSTRSGDNRSHPDGCDNWHEWSLGGC